MTDADVLRATAEEEAKKAWVRWNPPPECMRDTYRGLRTAFIAGFLASQDAGLEMAAKVVDAECERILSKQSGAAAPALQAEVDKQIRMTAMMLPGVAEAIRANGTQNFPSIAIELFHFVGRLRAASQANGSEG